MINFYKNNWNNVCRYDQRSGAQGQFFLILDATVFPAYQCLGWYLVTPTNTLATVHIQFHQKMLTVNESPLLLHLAVDRLSQGDDKEIPLHVYDVSASALFESGGAADTSVGVQDYFSPLEYVVESGEAERVAVEHVAQSRRANEAETTSVFGAHVQSECTAVQRLQERLDVIRQYALQVSRSDPSNEKQKALVQRITALQQQLQANEDEDRDAALERQMEDALMLTLVAAMTKSGYVASDVADKAQFMRPQPYGSLSAAAVAGGHPGASGRRHPGGRAGFMGRGDPFELATFQ
jgi:COP9 signalosome complex subunit 6